MICNSAVYAKELESSQLPGLYYLISWKGFLEEHNTLEPALAIQHLRKLVSIFYNKNLDKPSAISTLVDTVPPTARSIIQLEAQNNRQKQGQPAMANSIRKRFKKN